MHNCAIWFGLIKVHICWCEATVCSRLCTSMWVCVSVSGSRRPTAIIQCTRLAYSSHSYTLHIYQRLDALLIFYLSRLPLSWWQVPIHFSYENLGHIIAFVAPMFIRTSGIVKFVYFADFEQCCEMARVRWVQLNAHCNGAVFLLLLFHFPLVTGVDSSLFPSFHTSINWTCNLLCLIIFLEYGRKMVARVNSSLFVCGFARVYVCHCIRNTLVEMETADMYLENIRKWCWNCLFQFENFFLFFLL